MVFESNISFEINESLLFRRLRIEDEKESSVYARKKIRELKDAAKDIVKRNGYYMIGDKLVTGIPMVDCCQKQVICLSSLSQDADDYLGNLIKSEDYFEAYLLNEILNEDLFSISAQMNKEIMKRLKKENLFLTKQYAPGDNNISLSIQKILYDLISKEMKIDVKINESFVLIPEKTLLYAFGADPDNPEICIEHNCGECDNTDCCFRI